MSQGVSIDQLSDYIQSVQRRVFPKGMSSHPEYTLQLRDCHVVDKWMNNARRMTTGGDQLQVPVSMEEGTSSRFVQMYQETPAGVSGDRPFCQVQWKMHNFNYMFEEREELLNKPSNQIFDLVEARATDEMRGAITELETACFEAPPTASDTLNPNGLQYWLVGADKGTAPNTSGFIGKTAYYGDGSATTNIGNIDANIYDNWRNWADVTPTNTTLDYGWLNKHLKPALVKTKFKTPAMIRGAESQNYMDGNFTIYCGINEYLALDTQLENRSGNTQGDLSAIDGGLRYRGIPIMAADPLDNLAHRPFIGVNHNHFRGYVKDGEWFKQTKPMIAGATQHRTLVVQVDSMFNFLCKNRRHGGFVIHEYRA